MGALCCCPCGEDFDEYAHPNSSLYRHCICLRFFFHQLFNGYMFQRLDGRTVTSPVQGATPLASTGLSNPSDDSSFSDTHHLLPRPPPYDTDPRYPRLHRGLVSRREKGVSHIQEDSQIRRSTSSSGVEHLGSGKKRNITDAEEECNSNRSESQKLSTKGSYGAGYIMVTSEDEDVCPTCLDDYTLENPKIVTRCSHHFHLGCIYEWMERSDFCPICGKEMEFCESP
ncbi:E3 ubiquitin-protein ligase-like [Iris pallida]|uniref:RING-type E3 ubiquitin transferase n=1 Tax=Iris pallida TaxID=29817 RepID=A0AAX6H8C1_IRIPA|nr:E3 ubiquitin-protein ligase-like [Iris pallida]KAJ6842272.1 E3 ubiquitin-protein ligase-like [Iris pallida]